MAKNYAWTYDAKGNILTATAPNGAVTSYTYDPDYSLPLTISVPRDDTHTTLTTNTLAADKKTIVQTVVTEGGAQKEKQLFTWSAAGNLTSQKVYLDTESYIERQFVYADGAQISEEKTLGVKKADGTAAAGSPGYSAGIVVTKTDYNARGWPSVLTDANGNQTQLAYDASGRVTSVTYPDGAQETYVHDTANRTITHTDVLGSTLEHRYDPYGNEVAVFDTVANRLLCDKKYDSFNRLYLETWYNVGAPNRTSYYYYDARGRVTETGTRDEDGVNTSRTTTLYQDGLGKQTVTVEGETSAPSIVTTAYFDVMGNCVKKGRFLNGTEYFDLYTYDKAGNLTQEKTAYTTSLGGSYTWRYTYDHAGRVLTTQNALGKTASSTYDWAGRKLTDTDYRGNTTSYDYDALSRQVRVTAPFDDTNNAVTEWTYDPNGNVTSERVQSNAAGAAAAWRVTDRYYDSRSRLVRVTAYPASGVQNHTQYYYDAAGNLLRLYTGLTSPLTIAGLDIVSGGSAGYAVQKYTYDRYGNLVTQTDALGRSETYTYDLFGMPVTKTDRTGTVTTNVYDERGQLLSVTATQSGVQTGYAAYTYAKTGARLTETDGTFTRTRAYDALGRLTGEDETGGIAKTYTYNIAGLRSGFVMKRNAGTCNNASYTYDALGRLTVLKESGATVATYSYDDNGNRTQTSYPTGNRTVRTYNKANLPLVINNRSKDGVTTLQTYSLYYYVDGSLGTRVDNTRRRTYYTYDGMGRLTLERDAPEGTTITRQVSFAYDARGNRTSVTSTGTEAYTQTCTYDLANRLQSETRTEGGASTVTQYAYDLNGRMTSKTVSGQTTSYTYDGFGRMTGVTGPGVSASYTYQPDGLRRSKTVGTEKTTHIWDGDKVCGEISNDTTYHSRYLWGDGLAAFDRGNARRYFYFNAHGDVTLITDANGDEQRRYDYDAYGEGRAVEGYSGSYLNPFRYSGEYFDEETGFYYLRARYYDPSIGRFLTEDPAGDGTNWYAYCGNDPVNFVDPTGMWMEGDENYSSQAQVYLRYYTGLWESDYQRLQSVRTDAERIAVQMNMDNIHALAESIRLLDTTGRVKGNFYDVPLFSQGTYNLCWAFSQVMVDAYYTGESLTQKQATSRALTMAKSVYGMGWNKGAWPLNSPDVFSLPHLGDTRRGIRVMHDQTSGILAVENYAQLSARLSDGPIYGYFSNEKVKIAHLIVITGAVSATGHENLVASNNPWGNKNIQTYDAFQSICIDRRKNVYVFFNGILRSQPPQEYAL